MPVFHDDGDDLIELVETFGPGDSALGAPVTGRPEPKVEAWAKPAQFVQPLKTTLINLDEALPVLYPLGYASLKHLEPKRSLDDWMVDGSDQTGREAWEHFGKEVAREEARLLGVSAGNLVTSGRLLGNGDPVALPCRRCGQGVGMLDGSGVCWGGCGS